VLTLPDVDHSSIFCPASAFVKLSSSEQIVDELLTYEFEQKKPDTRRYELYESYKLTSKCTKLKPK
jgi:hypothetical protein